MRAAVLWLVIVAVTVFHVWASQRSEPFWYLGGIVPAAWLGLNLVRFALGGIDWGRDWAEVLPPTGVLLLLWLVGRLEVRMRRRSGKGEGG